MILTVMMVLVFAGAAFAWWDGPGMGYGSGSYSGANAETMKKFQKGDAQPARRADDEAD